MGEVIREVLEVRGGVAGLGVALEELHSLAAQYDEAATRMLDWAADGAAVLVDPDLIASAPLAPVTFAEAEACVLSATAGPDGIGVQALGWQADAAALRLTASRLESTEDLVAAGFGLLGAAVATAPRWIPIGADLLGRLYPDGHGHARSLPGLAVPASRTAPRTVHDVVRHLAQLSELSRPEHPARSGTVAVQTLTAPDGRVRHLLLLPGTDDMTTRPWTRDRDVRDMGVNLELAGDAPNDYAEGVLAALERAGVGPGESVLVAGHSQGGLLAARLLADVDEHGYALTHAVILGAPIAQVDGYPAEARLLALEQRGDVVPLLDSGANPETRGQVTVRFDSAASGLLERHSFPAYAAGAALVDASTHPSVTDQVASMEAAGFLRAPEGTVVTSQIFQVVRR